jgi:CRISPR-associated protein Cas8b/Csh1 subtype I-B
VLKEPLPFFTLDKPSFLPELAEDNADKAFPLCANCYGNIQKGARFVEQNLIFGIPNTRGSKRIFFWIIPILHEPSLVKEFLRKPKSGLESFKEMLEFSGRAETARDIDVKMSRTKEDDEDDAIASSFLTYSAIFHYYNQQKHMRLLGTVDGIYPSRLRELSEKKLEVDKIAINCGYNASFHFGLITDFIEQDTEGWMRIMTYAMSRIFTNKQLGGHFVSKILINAAKEPFRKRLLQSSKPGQEAWYEIMLKATITLEYFYRVRALLSMENRPESTLPNDEKARMAANFLNSHSGMLHNKNLRAICAIGIAVGIVVKAQQRYLGSDSFISRLNRLEMDYQRLKGLFPLVFIKLKYYKAEEYAELLTYLGNEEISNLDRTQQVDNETMNLIFSIGMCHGFTIFGTTIQGKTTGDNRL